jgi:hypothetical protein
MNVAFEKDDPRLKPAARKSAFLAYDAFSLERYALNMVPAKVAFSRNWANSRLA